MRVVQQRQGSSRRPILLTDNVCHLRLTANIIVGRDEELALVDGLLARGREQGTALLLYGEPGVGKSTLAAIAVASARARTQRC